MICRMKSFFSGVLASVGAGVAVMRPVLAGEGCPVYRLAAQKRPRG
jgi:hypothetical protein